MATEILLREFNSLPKHLQAQVVDFILFLKNTKLKDEVPQLHEESARKIPKAGFGKYKIVMAPDFDEPLEEFKEYM